MYQEDEYLALSGVQHFAFCPRQWALIHVEQSWKENSKTVEGEHVHERCHDGHIKEHRGDILIIRGLRVSSAKLGLSGICDVVEFSHAENGIHLLHETEKWMPAPVEYKRGKTKFGNEDRVQLCAQAMALEEMFHCDIKQGFLYYHEKRRRDAVVLDKDLRDATIAIAKKMHDAFDKGITSKPKKRRGCQSCSMYDLCMPELEVTCSTSEYIKSMLKE